MSYAPFRDDTRVYKGTTFGFSFTIDEDGSALDLTTLDKVEAKLFSSSTDVFSFDTDGDLTISGTDSNIVSGMASESTMDIAKRVYYLELRFHFADGRDDVYAVIDIKIIDAESDQSQGAHDWVLDIDNDSETVTGQATSNLAEAIAAKEDTLQLKSDVETLKSNLESNLQGVTDNLQTLIDLEEDSDQLIQLQPIKTELLAIHSNLSSITTVEDALTTINAVNDKLTQIQTVFDNLDNIETVAGIDTEISDVSQSSDNVDTVATNIQKVDTVAGSIQAIQTAADNISDIQDAADNAQLAKDYAIKPEDQAVETNPDTFSALHHSAKSEESETLSKNWANEDEGVVVQNGEFSSYHWAKKSEGHSNNAATEVQEKIIQAHAFYIKDQSDIDIEPTVILGPSEGIGEHPAVNLTRNSGGNAISRIGDLRSFGNDEWRYNYNRATGIFEGRYVEGQATRLNTQFSAPTTNEDVTVNSVEHTISFWGSGSITLSGTHSETINGTESVTRTEVQFTPSAGTLTISPSGGIEFLQLEEGSAATSPIAGDGQQKTRDPDIAEITDLDAINFNPQEGAFVMEAKFTNNDSSTSIIRGDASFNNSFLYHSGTSNKFRSFDGSNLVDYLTTSNTNIYRTFGIAYKGSDFAGSIDGASVIEGSVSNIANSISSINIADEAFNGHIKNLTYYPRRLSNAKLQALTS